MPFISALARCIIPFMRRVARTGLPAHMITVPMLATSPSASMATARACRSLWMASPSWMSPPKKSFSRTVTFAPAGALSSMARTLAAAFLLLRLM